MDLDIEKIHNILIQADLPSSINDLKNPTEEFVVNLINTFLRRFHIDVGAIDKPTMEQQDIMKYCEDSDIIKLINLHVVMVQICDRIYLKDLCITDISSPGSKKVRKHAKLLVNFILYATNKESDIADEISKIQNKGKLLHETIEKKNEIIQAKNEKALSTAKHLSVKEKCTAEIQKLQLTIEKNNKKYIELMAKVNKAEEKKHKAVERCGTKKAEASKLSKTLTELQSEIVKSPEEYKMRLNELEKQQTDKVKERETMQEAFLDKKHLIEQQTNILNFVQKQLEKFVEVQDIYHQLKNVDIQEDNIRKQVDVLRADITEFEKRLQSQKEQHEEIEIHNLHAQYEERLVPLRNLSMQLLSNKKLCKERLEEMKMKYNDEYLKLEKSQSTIKKLEEETVALIKNYQDLYDSEILIERHFMENVDK